MALNWTMLSSNRTPILLPNETIINAVPQGVDLTLTIPTTPPVTSIATAGGSGGLHKHREPGGIWVTDQRLIFATISSGPKPGFESLSVPLPSLLSTKFQQPVLGSNYLAFEIKPASGGGLTEGTMGELRFRDRPMFEFVSSLEKTREKAIYMKRQESLEEESLPTYTSPPPPEASSSSGTSVAFGVTIDNPPGYDASL